MTTKKNNRIDGVFLFNEFAVLERPPMPGQGLMSLPFHNDWSIFHQALLWITYSLAWGIMMAGVHLSLVTLRGSAKYNLSHSIFYFEHKAVFNNVCGMWVMTMKMDMYACLCVCVCVYVCMQSGYALYAVHRAPPH